MAGPSPGFLAQLNSGLGDPFAAAAAKAGYEPKGPVADVPPENALYGAPGGAPIHLPGVPAPPPAPEQGPPAAAPAGGAPAPGPGVPREGGSPYLQANPGDVEFAPVTSPGS